MSAEAKPNLNSETCDDVKKRLRRIEGQVRGVLKMIEDERECADIIQQLTAIRSAVQQTSAMLARSYACQCLAEPRSKQDQQALIEDLLNVLSKAS